RGERGAALSHHAYRLRPIPARGECTHEKAVSRFAKCVSGDEAPRHALSLLRARLVDLGIADRLQRLQLDVAERPSFRFDPFAVLARKESACGDLVRDHRFRPCPADVALPADGTNMIDRRP